MQNSNVQNQRETLSSTTDADPVEVLMVSKKEVLKAAMRIVENESLGLDNSSNKGLKAAVEIA